MARKSIDARLGQLEKRTPKQDANAIRFVVVERPDGYDAFDLRRPGIGFVRLATEAALEAWQEGRKQKG